MTARIFKQKHLLKTENLKTPVVMVDAVALLPVCKINSAISFDLPKNEVELFLEKVKFYLTRKKK